MMTNPEELSDIFFGQNLLEEVRQDELDAVRARMQARLMADGVIFIDENELEPEICDALDYVDGVIGELEEQAGQFLSEEESVAVAGQLGPEFQTLYELIRVSEENNRRLNLLLVRVGYHLDAVSAGGSAEDSYKKQVQAMLLAEGCSQAWLDAVGAELPGDPLDPVQDQDIIAHMHAEHIESEMQREARHSRAVELFMELAGVDNGETTDGRTRLMVHRLAQVFAFRNQWLAFPESLAREPWPATAIHLLLNHHFKSDERWRRIISLEERPIEEL